MADQPGDPAALSARAAIAAVRALVETFGSNDASKAATETWRRFIAEANEVAIYQLLALAAATVRWASHETGHTEAEIVDELAANF